MTNDEWGLEGMASRRNARSQQGRNRKTQQHQVSIVLTWDFAKNWMFERDCPSTRFLHQCLLIDSDDTIQIIGKEKRKQRPRNLRCAGKRNRKRMDACMHAYN